MDIKISDNGRVFRWDLEVLQMRGKSGQPYFRLISFLIQTTEILEGVEVEMESGGSLCASRLEEKQALDRT